MAEQMALAIDFFTAKMSSISERAIATEVKGRRYYLLAIVGCPEQELAEKWKDENCKEGVIYMQQSLAWRCYDYKTHSR